MKLYDLPRGKWFILTEDTQAPPDIGGYSAATVMRLATIDGMYSRCYDMYGQMHHPAAWSEVAQCEDPL